MHASIYSYPNKATSYRMYHRLRVTNKRSGSTFLRVESSQVQILPICLLQVQIPVGAMLIRVPSLSNFPFRSHQEQVQVLLFSKFILYHQVVLQTISFSKMQCNANIRWHCFFRQEVQGIDSEDKITTWSLSCYRMQVQIPVSASADPSRVLSLLV